MNEKRNIVITGIGVVSPIGIGKNAYWEGLIEGKTGFKAITLFETAPFGIHVAGEISDFNPVDLLGKKGLRELDRSTRLVNAAAKLALDDGRLDITEDNTHSTGVSVGSTFGSLHSISQFDRQGLIDGPRYVNPSLFPNTVLNSPASRISIRFRIKGFNTTISTGFCAGLDAISYACDFIRLKRVHRVLAGGVEELCEETFHGFHALGCLSGSDGSEPRCCPFDRRRNGTVLSEGAAVLILEDEEQAVRRGAHITARILGCGNHFDPEAKRDFSHEGKGLKEAIALALHDAGIASEDIECIIAGANSTKGLDRLETRAIKEMFGNRAYAIPVTAIKSMIGESFSASGSLAVVAAAGIVTRHVIPATVNYRERDPECDLDCVPNESRQKNVGTVLVLAADPYGNNSAVIVGTFPGNG